MAHIPDGVLAAPVPIAGAVCSVGLLEFALRRLDYERLPQAAALAAAFFVSSLVNVPIWPSSVHSLPNGLMGLLLGGCEETVASSFEHKEPRSERRDMSWR